MTLAVRALDDRFVIALGTAAGALALRGIGILTGVLQGGGTTAAGIVEETAILVVSAALVAALNHRKRPHAGILENSQTLLDQSPNPIMIKRANGEYIYMNPSFEVAFECKAEDLLGKIASEIWSHDISDAAQEGDVRTLQSGKPSFEGVTSKLVYPDLFGSRRRRCERRFRSSCMKL